MNQLIQLWQKAVQDELNVVPRNGLIADLFLAACNNYVDLVALGKEHVLVRLATDASDTLQWVASAHVTSLPALPSGACHDPPRRSLEKDLEPQSASPPQSPREVRPVRAGDDGSTGRRHQENDEPAHNRHSRGQPLEVLPPTSASPFSHALLPTASALLSAIASDAQRRLLSCAECRQRAVADSKIMRLRCPTLHANHPPLQRRRLRRPGVRQLRLKYVPTGRERK